MPAMTLTALRAKHGDALLLTADGATVLIDGGPPGVYNRSLRPALAALDAGGVEPPVIDLLMVSHIDSDHIAGVLDLTGDMIDAEQEERRKPVRIRRVWFNSFADTIARTGLATPSAASASAASVASAFEDMDVPGADHGCCGMVLSSVGQGRGLRRDLDTLSIEVNAWFDGRLALAGAAATPWTKNGLEIEVIGPTGAEVDKLKKEWAKQLPKILKKEAEAASLAAAAQSLDRSVFNLSSIVVIARAGGKSMLLTGDARGDMILRWLEAAGYPGGRAHFDVVKLPHHGSDRNVTPEFFEKVTADHYVVSGDGKHGNPEPGMFDMLFAARGQGDYEVCMTYSVDEIMRHRDYKKDGKGIELGRVLDVQAWRRGRLKAPVTSTGSISVAL